MTWQELRQMTLERDGHTCQGCGANDRSLDIHHIIPRERGGQDTLRNLISLCTGCHRKAESEYLPPVMNNIIKFRCNPVITGNKILFIVPKFYHKNLKKFNNRVIDVTVDEVEK